MRWLVAGLFLLAIVGSPLTAQKRTRRVATHSWSGAVAVVTAQSDGFVTLAANRSVHTVSWRSHFESLGDFLHEVDSVLVNRSVPKASAGEKIEYEGPYTRDPEGSFLQISREVVSAGSRYVVDLADDNGVYRVRLVLSPAQFALLRRSLSQGIAAAKQLAEAPTH